MSTFEIKSAKLETDQDQLRNLGGRKLMTAVSPWFFTVLAIPSCALVR
jgi:hypothetical protein